MINRHVYVELSSIYEQKHRHYHNLTHIHHCLGELETYIKANGLTLKRELEYAIWFHDAIYNPFSTENEENSAKLFFDYSKSYDFSCNVELVCDLILGTKRQHVMDPAFEMEHRLMNDIDCLILAEPDYAKYLQYVTNVQKEYSHLSSEKFMRGRKQFLLKMLEQEKVFHSPAYQARNEIAKKNMSRELNDYWR